MPRILHLRTVTGHGGGPEKTLLNSQRFVGGGYELRLAYIRPANDPNYDLPERAARQGVSLVDIPERGPADPRTLWRLIREIRDFRPHVLHPHDYKTNILAVLLARWFRIPVVTTMHGYVTLGGRLDWYYRLDRWALRRMDHVVAVSEDLVQVLEQQGIPPERYTVVDNGVDCEHFARSNERASAKEQWGLSADRLVIGGVGRLAAEKGLDVLVHALQRLLDRGYDVEMLVAGDGPEREKLLSLGQELGCSDRVHLVGHQADSRKVFEALDVFTLPSLREGLPNSLLEALAMELPVVATAVGGVPRVVANGQNGFLLKTHTADELTAALMLLLDDANLRQRFGQQGRLIVEQRFSFRVRMTKIRGIYDRVLARRSLPNGMENEGSPQQVLQ